MWKREAKQDGVKVVAMLHLYGGSCPPSKKKPDVKSFSILILNRNVMAHVRHRF